MSGAISPSGKKHPGKILHEDLVDGRRWTKKASEVPQSIAWVNVDDDWHAVVRIEITGAAGRRHISKFGIDGNLLESTIQGH